MSVTGGGKGADTNYKVTFEHFKVYSFNWEGHSPIPSPHPCCRRL